MDSMKYVQGAKGRILTQSDLSVVAWPLTFYYIGISEERLGHRAEAVSLFQKFLNLWRAGDSGGFQTADARKRLSQLSRL